MLSQLLKAEMAEREVRSFGGPTVHWTLGFSASPYHMKAAFVGQTVHWTVC